MIAYSNIGSKVWKSSASLTETGSQTKEQRDAIDFLDYQVSQWMQSIPENLRYIHPNSAEYAQYAQHHPDEPHGINGVGGRALHRLRATLYLRANQMRILIYRPVLHSASSMLASNSRDSAQKVVDIAKDTIRVLTHINTTSDLYRTQPMCFNYFLLSALAVLFLAVSHAPVQFSEQCRDEFYMALELVRGLSVQSAVGKRLWRTIRSLKEIGPKLGLYARNGNSADETDTTSPSQRQSQQAQHDAHSSAAMAMAGLAGHPIDEAAFFATHQAGHVPTNSTMLSPNGMANDLTSLFEAAGGYGMTIGQSSTDASTEASGAQGDATAALKAMGHSTGPGMAWGNEEELNRVMRDMF